MFSKKGYLVSIGELPPGSENKQGRISVAHDQLCREAAAKGVQIQGYSVSATTKTDTAPVVEKAKPNGEKQVVELAPYRYSEDEFRVFERVNGKKKYRSLREVCRHSRISLVGCPCDSHRIVATDGTGDVTVFIEPIPKEGDR